ncbi:MAG: diacylglycerol/polyprenol kinase family protein [Bacteroidota bacterium]
MNYQEMPLQITYRTELVRKAIHLSSLSIPVIYLFIAREQALMLLLPATIFFIIIDLGRYYFLPLQTLFYQSFGSLLRSHETDTKRKRLNGATYVLIAASLCVYIFPKYIALTSFTILIIGDMMAALIGRKYGKHRFNQKSIEGTLAFIASGFLIILLTPKIDYRLAEYLIGFVAVIIGALVEALIVHIDDNLAVPLSAGTTMWFAYSLLLPTLNVFKWG